MRRMSARRAMVALDEAPEEGASWPSLAAARAGAGGRVGVLLAAARGRPGVEGAVVILALARARARGGGGGGDDDLGARPAALLDERLRRGQVVLW